MNDVDAFVRGDLVEYRGERGIICAEDPLVMRTTAFHSYVAIVDRRDAHVVEHAHDTEDCTIREEVLERIKRYYDERAEKMTGGA